MRRRDTGGRGHARAHYQLTNHPIAVKLGTIRADGTADVWCYACDDAIVDYSLQSHVGNYGINMESQKKTENTTREIEASHATKTFKETSIEEARDEEHPVVGRHLVGFKNTGNTCYIACALHMFFASKFVGNAYSTESCLRHIMLSHPNGELHCPTCQLIKVANSLLSSCASADSPLHVHHFKIPWLKGTRFEAPVQNDVDEFIQFFLRNYPTNLIKVDWT